MPRFANDDAMGPPQSELDMLEQAMSSMMQSTFSSFFRSFMEPTIVFGNENHQRGGHWTTIFDSRSSEPISVSGSSDFDGSDFRRLANKSRQNRGLPSSNDSPSNVNHDEQDNTRRTNDGQLVGWTESSPVSPMTNLLQFMFGSVPSANDAGMRPQQQPSLFDLVLSTNMEDRLFRHPPVENTDNSGSSYWSFSSTSQRRVIKPDGTEETYYTRTQNGVTETIKKIKHPDGTIEETRESGAKPGGHPTLLPLPNERKPPSIPDVPENSSGPSTFSGLWKRLFG